MTEQSKATRPSQVTMAGWMAIVGSALLVLTVFDSVSRLRTLEFRNTVEEFLSTPPGSGLGLDIERVVEIMRGLMLVSGAASAAAVVLGVYVLKRHNAARVGFTVVAVAIMLTGPVTGGFLPVIIAFAAIMLWTRPARDWFAGRPVTQPAQHPRHRVEGSLVSSDNDPTPKQSPGTGGGAGETPSWPRMPEEGSQQPAPPPTHGFGTPPDRQGPPGQEGQGGEPGGQQGEGGRSGHRGDYPGQHGGPSYPQGGQPPYPQGPQYGPPPYGQGAPQYGYPPQYPPPGYYGGSAPADPDARPTSVTAAVWITWVLSALSIMFFLVVGLVMVAAEQQFVRQLEQDATFQQFDVPTDQVIAALWVMGAIALFWGIAAMVLGWFAYRRANWARIALVVSAASTVLFSLLTFPVGLLHTLAAGAVIVLLFVGGAPEWYRRGGAHGQPPQGPYGGHQYGGGQGSPYPQQYGAQQYGGQPYGQQPGQYGGGQAPPYGGQPPRREEPAGHQPPYAAPPEDPRNAEQRGEQPAPGGRSAHPDEDRREPRKEDPPANV